MSKFGENAKGFAALAVVLGAQAFGCLIQCAFLALSLVVGFWVLHTIAHWMGIVS